MFPSDESYIFILFGLFLGSLSFVVAAAAENLFPPLYFLTKLFFAPCFLNMITLYFHIFPSGKR